MSFKVNNEYSYNTYATQQNKTQAAKTAEAVAEETKATTTNTAKNTDSFVKSTPEAAVTYTPDKQRIAEMKAELASQSSTVMQMVKSLFGDQANFANDPFKALREIQAAGDRSMEFADNAEWGVDAVADRILEFAKALSGGDPEKAETLRKAVQDGFKAAEKSWGGKLPEISQKTYDKVMQGFDEWVNPKTEESAGTEEVAAK